MAFRTLEISRPADVHVRNGQLEIMNEDGTIHIPLEDLMTITCVGANIRMSTMAQAHTLSLLGRDGSEKVVWYANGINDETLIQRKRTRPKSTSTTCIRG